MDTLKNKLGSNLQNSVEGGRVVLPYQKISKIILKSLLNFEVWGKGWFSAFRLRKGVKGDQIHIIRVYSWFEFWNLRRIGYSD